MSWTHSSSAVLLGLVILIAGAGAVAAVSVSGEAPAPAAVGEEVSMTATIESPFEGAPDEYTLRAETALRAANWSIEVRNQGRLVERSTAAGPNITQSLSLESGATTVNVSVTGAVPEMEEFNYTQMSVENYTVIALSQQDGNAVAADPWRSHRYTPDSREARLAIDNASAAVTAAEGTGDTQLRQAIDAYNGENFDNAVSLAQEAERTAEEAQGGLPLLPIIGGVVVVVLVGGGLYYRSRQQSDYKLQ